VSKLLIALMMEAARTTETLVNYQTARRNNPEDSHLSIHCVRKSPPLDPNYFIYLCGLFDVSANRSDYMALNYKTVDNEMECTWKKAVVA
jgi:hypothetical protein